MPPAQSIPVIVRRGANTQPAINFRRFLWVADVIVTARAYNKSEKELTISMVVFLSAMGRFHITQYRKNAAIF